MGLGSKKDEHKDVVVEESAKKLLTEKAKNNHIACAQAFDCADKLGLTREKTGIYLDKLTIRLEKCQLGLFGHGTGGKGKKFIDLTDQDKKDIKSALEGQVADGVTTCPELWKLADATGLKRMKLSSYCETAGLKIKGCQLGAF